MESNLFLNLVIVVPIAVVVIFLLHIGLKRIYKNSVIIPLMLNVDIAIITIALMGFVLGMVGLSPIYLSLMVLVGVTIIILTILRINHTVIQPIRKLQTISQDLTETDLTNLASVIDSISRGDLTSKVSLKAQEVEVKSSDELGQLTNDFNFMIRKFQEMGYSFQNMTDSLRSLVIEIHDNADSLGAASEQLSVVASQAGEATNQIARTIQQLMGSKTDNSNDDKASITQLNHAIETIAEGAQEQANAVSKASQVTSFITTAIDKVIGNINHVSGESGEAAQVARYGAETVQDNIQGMMNIRESVENSAARVRELGERSDQIGSIIQTIDEIASQTNLLALNAAIEAARAGEEGKGFAVVADEVRKLAERSGTATQEIGELIRVIQHMVSDAVSAMEVSARQMEAGVEKANESGKSLEGILKGINQVSEQAELAAKAADEMNKSSNELISAMDLVSAVVQENTASTEEMSASSVELANAIEAVTGSTEEMSAQVEEMSSSVESLADMAGNLQLVVSRFTV